MRVRKLGISGLLLLTACGPQVTLDRLAGEEEAIFAQAHLGLYPVRDEETIMAQLDTSVVDETFPEALEPVFDLFPNEDPTEVLLVGFNRFVGQDSQTFNLTFQMEFSDRWLLAAVALKRQDSGLTVVGVNIQPSSQSLQEVNSFDLARNGLLGWVVLALTTLIPLFCIGTFIWVLLTPIAKRKWVWALFTLVGVGTVSFNWATGQVGYSVISIQLLGAGLVKAGPYAPWILSFAFPIGAIAFLSRRRSLMRHLQTDES